MSEKYQTMTKKIAMEILELPINYTEKDLRANYREKIKINHPDHNGDERLAQEINLAYELLKGQFPSSTRTEPKLSYKDLKIKEIKNMVVGYDESLPEWLKERYDNIVYRVDDMELSMLMNKRITKEEIDKTANAYRNEVIRLLKDIEIIFCQQVGITISNLIEKGYTPINDYSTQYNIKEIYNKLLLAYSKIFKDEITAVLNKYNNQSYGSLKQSIEDKISELNEKLLSSKLKNILEEFDNYLNDIHRQYEHDKNLVITLQSDYSDFLNQNSEELNNLYNLCGKKEFEDVYNELTQKLKNSKKEQDSAVLVSELNNKFSYALLNINSLQETIRLNKLYCKLLEIINNIELTADVISLISSISMNNIEKDMNDIIQILDVKINDIYIPRFRTDVSVPLYISCRLYNKKYFIKIIYKDGQAQLVEEANYDNNKQVSLAEVLKLSTFVGGTKTAIIDVDNSVIYEYNDPNLNRFEIIKNKSTNTIELYGSNKYMSYKNGNKIDADLTKYQDINTILNELTKELMPYVEKYLHENVIKSNGRSK